MMNDHENDSTPARNRFEKYLHKLHPELTDDNIVSVLSDMQRLVRVITKIQIEPQAQISYKDTTKKGKVTHWRNFTTDLHEFKKVIKKNTPIGEAFATFTEAVTKGKDG